MQNSSLKNEVLNKALLITLEFGLTDPDDPYSEGYMFKKASMGPVALKTMLPPLFAVVQILDSDGNILGYEYAFNIMFNIDGSDLYVYTPNVTMCGTFATDSWAVYTG